VIPNQELVFLGKTGMTVSPVGVGTMAWGDRFFWGYGRSYGEADVKAAFDASLGAGINFIDTAEIYGQGVSETLLGQFLCESPRPSDAPPIVVATKFFPYPWRLYKGSLKLALRSSLKRLQMERVDLYQVHWPFPPVPIETWASALADVVEEGLARAVGVSNYNANQMRKAQAVLAKRGVFLASNQVEYSLINRKIERNGLLNLCHEIGLTCIAYSPLGRGILTGKYSSKNPPLGIRSRQYSSKFLDQVEPLIYLLLEIGREHGEKTPGQVALNWVMSKGAVPIPGAKNLHQAQENSGTLGWQLSESEIIALDKASDHLS
jgi:aryl-alcohol dehydrogenase-like predicted oxidoreductase